MFVRKQLWFCCLAGLVPALCCLPATAQVVSTEMDSSAFIYQYNFDVDWITPDLEDIDSNGTYDFVLGGGAPTVTGGIGSFSNSYMMSSAPEEIWQQAPSTQPMDTPSKCASKSTPSKKECRRRPR